MLYPLIIFFALLFSTGVAFILSIAYVFFGDVKHLYSVLLTLWMYCSALFYPVEMLPEYVKRVVVENPLFNYINCARRVMMWGQLPTFPEILRMVLWGVGMFVVGYLVFEKNKNKVMQKM